MASSEELAVVKSIDTPVPCVVDEMRRLLELSEKGQVIGYAYTVILSDGGFATGFSHADETRLVGGLEFVKRRILDRIENKL